MKTTAKVANNSVWQNLSLENLQNEIWKSVPNFEENYLASSLGRIRSIDRQISCHQNHKRFSKGTVLSPSKKSNGYLGVTLFKNGDKKYISVHRIIANTFLPNPEKLPQVNHKNGNPKDNSVSNLEWITVSDNIKHSFDNLNKKSPTGMKGILGKDNPLSIKINQFNIDGSLVKAWDSMNDAKREGFGIGNIFSCCKGIRKTHKGFIWKYA